MGVSGSDACRIGNLRGTDGRISYAEAKDFEIEGETAVRGVTGAAISSGRGPDCRQAFSLPSVHCREAHLN